MLEQLPGAPAAVGAALDRLRDELTLAAGQNLSGLILYGGLARGRYRPGKSDVNVIVLLHDASPAALLAVAPALRSAAREAAVEPLLLTPAEVSQSANAFPTKFLDIKNHHVVLAGVDPFPVLDITREQIRARTVQELHNLLLRLRNRFVAVGTDDMMLAQALTRAARPFALQLKALLGLAGKEVPADDRSSILFEAAARAFGIDREPLAGLALLRQDTRPAGDVTAHYRGVLEAVARAVAIADELQERP